MRVCNHNAKSGSVAGIPKYSSTISIVTWVKKTGHAVDLAETPGNQRLGPFCGDRADPLEVGEREDPHRMGPLRTIGRIIGHAKNEILALVVQLFELFCPGHGEIAVPGKYLHHVIIAGHQYVLAQAGNRPERAQQGCKPAWIVHQLH